MPLMKNQENYKKFWWVIDGVIGLLFIGSCCVLDGEKLLGNI